MILPPVSVLDEALEIYQEIGTKRDIGWALIHLAMPFAGRPDEYQHAQALTEEGLALLRETDDQPGVAQALTNLGDSHDCMAICQEQRKPTKSV